MNEELAPYAVYLLVGVIILSVCLLYSVASQIYWFKAFLFWFLKAEYWRESYEIYAEKIESFNKEVANQHVEYATKIIQEFCDNAFIENHFVKMGPDGIIMKIGDEQNMIEVDRELFFVDPQQALEDAKERWQKQD